MAGNPNHDAQGRFASGGGGGGKGGKLGRTSRKSAHNFAQGKVDTRIVKLRAGSKGPFYGKGVLRK